MFLHLSVILFTGWCPPHCMLGYTPTLGRHPTRQTSRLCRHPLGRQPLADTPARQTPLPSDHTGYGQQARDTHPIVIHTYLNYFHFRVREWRVFWLTLKWSSPRIVSWLAINDKYGVPISKWTWLYHALLEVSMNGLALWINVCADDWTTERAIIASNVFLFGSMHK